MEPSAKSCSGCAGSLVGGVDEAEYLLNEAELERKRVGEAPGDEFVATEGLGSWSLSTSVEEETVLSSDV